MSDLLAIVWSGVLLGSQYALLGVCLVVCQRVLKVVNLAVGAAFVLVCLLAATLQAAGVSVASTMVVTTLVAVALLPLQELAMLRFLAQAKPSYRMLATLAFAIAVQGLTIATLGRDPLSGSGFLPGGDTTIGLLRGNLDGLAFVVVVTLLAAVTAGCLSGTRAGRAACAAADDPDAATMLGISTTPLRIGALVLTGVLLGVAAVPYMAGATVDFTQGLPVTLLGFVAAAMFGFESVLGALLGGWIFGIAAALATGYVSSVLGEAIPFIALVVMLLIGRRYSLFPRSLTA